MSSTHGRDAVRPCPEPPTTHRRAAHDDPLRRTPTGWTRAPGPSLRSRCLRDRGRADLRRAVPWRQVAAGATAGRAAAARHRRARPVPALRAGPRRRRAARLRHRAPAARQQRDPGLGVRQPRRARAAVRPRHRARGHRRGPDRSRPRATRRRSSSWWSRATPRRRSRRAWSATGSSATRVRSSCSPATAASSRSCRPGTFLLRKNMTPNELVTALLDPPPNPYVEIALRTGLRLEQITAKLQTLPLADGPEGLLRRWSRSRRRP